jgi:hypothetical protein
MSVNRKLELTCPKGHGTYGADTPDEECPVCADDVPGVQDMLERIEGHLGGNWKDEYPGIEELQGDALINALKGIVDELPTEEAL